MACGQGSGEPLPASPTLLDRSPFLPPGWTPPEERRQQSQVTKSVTGYEFRGIYEINGEFRFLVSEPRSRSGSWVRVGESRDNFEVRRYDASSDTLVLFFNNKEQRIQMAEMESNPTPMPVSGQVQSKPRGSEPNQTRPARRTIRPASRTAVPDSGQRSTPPPPAWLQKLREEAAERRAQARGNVLPPSGVSASGSMDSPGFTPPPPPDGVPPTPPPDISGLDIPPPPDRLPPEPPAEIQQQILESINRRSRPGN